MTAQHPMFILVYCLCLLMVSMTLLAQNQDRISFARDIRIERGSVARDAVCICCSIIVEGELDGDAVAVGGDIVVSGVVDGDTVAAGGGINASSGARLGGDVVAVGGPAEIADGVTEVEVVDVPIFFLPGQRGFYLKGTLVFIGINITLLLLMGLLLKNRLERMAGSLTGRPILAVLSGTALLILFGWFVDAASELWFGEIIEFVAGVALCIFLLIGYAAISWKIGSLTFSKARGWLTILGGAALTTLILTIPVAGFVAMIFFTILSLGCVFLSGVGADSDWFVRKMPWRRGNETTL